MTSLPRWGSLTYSSFDDGVGAGGWQVKETRGQLSEVEQERLRSQISTTMDLAVPLPAFPTPADIEALPRRLVHLRDEDGLGCYWHTVFAGPDATGRPGNVFVHALVDRISDAPPAIRPIELWRSSGWLCPYGADAVRAATVLADGSVAPGTAVSRNRVLDFLLDPSEWRIGVLCALLDAVRTALRGGPLVVLGVASADAGALWLGAISQLTSAPIACRLGFSTYERAATLANARSRGLHVAAIPVTDLTSVPPGPEYVVIDSAETVTLGVAHDAPHVTAAGSQIEVSPWSMLAENALTDRASATMILDCLDHIAATMDTADCDVAWPLAAALATLGHDSSDAADTIGAVMFANAPPDLARDPNLAALVDELLHHRLGGTPAAAWEALREHGPTANTRAGQVYLRLAVSDPEWLAQAGAAPSDAALGEPHLATQARFDEQLARQVQPHSGDPQKHAQEVQQLLRLIEFGGRCGLAVDSVTRRVSEPVARVATNVVGPALAAPGAAALVDGTPTIYQAALLDTLRRATDSAAGQRRRGRPLAGLWVDPEVIAWLYPDGAAQFSVDDFANGRIDALQVGSSAAASVINTARIDVMRGRRNSPHSAVSMWFALAAASTDQSDVYERLAGDLAQLDVDPWDLNLMLGAFGTLVPIPPIVRALSRERRTHAQEFLAQSVARIDDRDERWAVPDGVTARTLAELSIASSPTYVPSAARSRRILGLVGSVPSESLGRVVVGERGAAFAGALAAVVLAETTTLLEETARLAVPPPADPMPRSRASGWSAAGHRPSPAARHAYAIDRQRGELLIDRLLAVLRHAGPRIEARVAMRYLRACLSEGVFRTDALVCAALALSAELPVREWPPFDRLALLDSVPIGPDGGRIVTEFTHTLIRAEEIEIETKEVAAVTDLIGRARFGIETWASDEARDEYAKAARRQWRDVVSAAETGRGSRGLLRRGR